LAYLGLSNVGQFYFQNKNWTCELRNNLNPLLID
jgi:hypothetical protein